jgi:hypothetical protein
MSKEGREDVRVLEERLGCRGNCGQVYENGRRGEEQSFPEEQGKKALRRTQKKAR